MFFVLFIVVVVIFILVFLSSPYLNSCLVLFGQSIESLNLFPNRRIESVLSKSFIDTFFLST